MSEQKKELMRYRLDMARERLTACRSDWLFPERIY